ncbi:hypothetical protein C5C31_08045 [Rathayibacter rathayi]|uniref:Uncharacterized protein n=1 Tax=Rathayibacter rathayi TaxID=33887 RepID=A0ABD6W5Z8_RATRA|nr:hypothetical protein [Rathayibacter rathayi]AZZ50251.1 hypothetical protein C1O28_14485 [Rathayibacter rathayi]MWV74455.1 hypothetical protein [Rathayibacter rathayi NCPPB 2980 = VKM Ac-1601]PPF10472.1 hypothetical protein C5C04_13240 [Rathayibacter rathayi]PPF46457.1 hypothetical protein C5C08_11665 [Rathayibacter rathayi]PPF76558.1 hypothetical protein C5C14_13600 [Rathayibacter rathayi]
MSKKIDAAHRALVEALDKHALLVLDKSSKPRKVERAGAELRAATKTYAALVSARTGIASPFADLADPRLDKPTIASLRAERDAIAMRIAKHEASTGRDGSLAG